MAPIRLQLAAAAAVFRRDLLVFMSHRSRLIGTFFTTAVSVALFYYVSRLVHARAVGSPDEYFAFVVVGLIIFGLLTSTLSLPVATVRAELQAGTFERIVLSPFGPVKGIVAMLLFPLGLSLLTGAASLGFSVLLFGLRVHASTLPLAVLVAILGGVSFAPFGLIMSATVVLFKQSAAGATFVIAGFSLLAGVYFPVVLLPGWIRWASEVQPFTPAVDLLRHLVVGSPLHQSVLLELLKLFCFAVPANLLAVGVLSAAIERSRRLGTIIEL